MAKLPTYYGNICLRLIPHLDMLLGTALEMDNMKMFTEIIQKYGKLYVYHESPAEFVTETIHYYFESPIIQNIDLKIQLLALLDGSTVTLSESFHRFMSTKDLSIF